MKENVITLDFEGAKHSINLDELAKYIVNKKLILIPNELRFDCFSMTCRASKTQDTKCPFYLEETAGVSCGAYSINTIQILPYLIKAIPEELI